MLFWIVLKKNKVNLPRLQNFVKSLLLLNFAVEKMENDCFRDFFCIYLLSGLKIDMV